MICYFLKRIFIILLPALILNSVSSLAHSMVKPNIVIIVADDLGWNDVGFHGSDILTPHLDKLAEEGMELGRFYTAPVCSPTRAGLLTGKYPDRFNLRNHVYSPRHKGGIPPEEQFLPEMLKQAGYQQRAAFGKWHLGHSDYKYHPNNQGFAYFYGHYNGAIDYYTHLRDGELDWHRNNEPCFDKGYSTDLIGREAVKFIRESDTESPFFAYVAFNAPHSPMQAKEEDLKQYGYDPSAEPEDYPVVQGHKGERGMKTYGRQGRGNTLRQTYAAMVSVMDQRVGDILKALKDKGIENNTLVWFLSDNGGIYEYGGNNAPLRGAKHTEWEGGVRTVSLVRWPAVIAPGSRSEECIAYIDLFPTVEQIVNGKVLSRTDGMDVSRALIGEKLSDRYIYLGNTGIVTKKWKMNQGELFLIEQDVMEKNDLSAVYPEKVKELNDRIDVFKKMQPEEAPEMQPEQWNPPRNWTMPVGDL